MVNRGKCFLRKKVQVLSALLATLSLFSVNSFATVIEYELTSLGGNEYRYDYSVTNDTLSGDIELFDIYFDPTLYNETSLNVVSSASINAGWSESILTSAPGFDALYDAYSFGGGISAGDTLSGFSIEFEWLGIGGPGAQLFDVYDALTFALLDTGTTTLRTNAVPAPPTVWLLLAGILALLGKKLGSSNNRIPV